VPRHEAERVKVLADPYCYKMGETVVDLVSRWFPGSRDKIEEVHIYRRGHPMCMSIPGATTRIAPKVRKPLGKLFFAHSDSEGVITEYTTAHKAAMRVSREVLAALRTGVAVLSPARPLAPSPARS
jgi:methionine synthase II (cobalamin-independent)